MVWPEERDAARRLSDELSVMARWSNCIILVAVPSLPSIHPLSVTPWLGACSVGDTLNLGIERLCEGMDGGASGWRVVACGAPGGGEGGGAGVSMSATAESLCEVLTGNQWKINGNQ